MKNKLQKKAVKVLAAASDTEDYGGINGLEGVAAHEFGHAIGILDGYAASYQNNYEPISSTEIYYNRSYVNYSQPQAGDIMVYNGRALANDVEMLFFTFSENSYQAFVPYLFGKTLEVSKAIKARAIYIKNNTLYEWNGIEMVIPDPRV